jgi:hypothetical protein
MPTNTFGKLVERGRGRDTCIFFHRILRSQEPCNNQPASHVINENKILHQMAQLNAFNAALLRCGFNADSADAITGEGFDTLEVLADVEEEDIDSMIKNIRETRRAQGAQAQGNVTFPFLVIRCLKAMHSWPGEFKRTDRALSAGLFAGAIITTAVLRHSLDAMRAMTQEDEDITKPKELMDLTSWEKFWEQWRSYMGRLRGAAKCPLLYVFKDHQLVDPTMHQVQYNDHDKCLVNTTSLTGPWFEVDNHRVYDKFKALVLKGPGWSFIKAYDRAKNGRGAVLALRRQYKGTSAVQSRKALAYAKIRSASYSRQKRTFTFDNYVEAHQEAHNTLADLNEPVPKTKKVTDFLAGITDSRLSNAKDLILGDMQKLQSFKICQQYLKTVVYNKSTQEKHERQISGLDRQRDGGKVRRTSDASPGKTSGMTARTYTREELSILSKEEREKVKELRKLRKTKNRGSSSRRASAIQVDSEEDSDDSS